MKHQALAYSEELLSGWGNDRRQWCRLYHPKTIDATAGVVAGPDQLTLISRGHGRSYGDAAVSRHGAVISHRPLNRLLAFDATTGVLTCEAGADFDEIVGCALPHGFFPLVTPGTRLVTVGGAIAADVHGKNHPRHGSFASSLLDFRLLTASGEIIHCSRHQNTRAFWATIGGMGLTGAVLEARIRLRRVASGYMSVEQRRTSSLDETLEAFDGDRSSYSVAWIDCLQAGRGWLTHAEHAPVDALPVAEAREPLAPPAYRNRKVPCYLPAGVVNRLTLRAFNELYYRIRRQPCAIVPYWAFFYPLDAVQHWNRVYGRRGFLQYQAVFPQAASRDALHLVLREIADSGEIPALAVLKRLGSASEGLLSFPMPGYTLAVDFPNTGARLAKLLARLDSVVLDFGGRVYLAKDARLSRPAFEQMYPRAAEFRAVKAELDPRGRFLSSLGFRLGMAEARGHGAPPSPKPRAPLSGAHLSELFSYASHR